MRSSTRRVLSMAVPVAAVAASLALGGAAAGAAPHPTAAPTAHAATDAPAPGAPGGRASGHEVPGATGAAAVRAAGRAGVRFRELTAPRSARASAAQAQTHRTWGVQFSDTLTDGLMATQSVAPGLTIRNNDFLYAPTAISGGKSCMELTTAYTSSGPKLWAYNWVQRAGRGREGRRH